MDSTPVSSLATTSLVLGLAGWFIYILQWCFDLSLGLVLALTTAGAGAVCSAGLDILPFVLWVAGIVSGHVALRQIRHTGERGRGRAAAGLLLGYSGLFLIIILIVLLVILVAAGFGSGWLEKFFPFHPTGMGGFL